MLQFRQSLKLKSDYNPTTQTPVNTGADLGGVICIILRCRFSADPKIFLKASKYTNFEGEARAKKSNFFG